MTIDKNKKVNSGPIDPLTELLSTLMNDFITLISKAMSKAFELGLEHIGARNKKKVIMESFIANHKESTDLESLGHSVSYKRDVKFSEIPMQRHNLLLGGSGFGKSNLISLLMEHKIRQDSPLVYFDPKGSKSEINQFKNLHSFYDKECLIFSELYPHDLRYNPLNGLNHTQRTQIIMRSLEWSEGEARYYKDQSQRALMLTLKDLEKEKSSISLPTIYRHLLEHRDNKETSGLIAQLEIIMSSPFAQILEDDGYAYDMRKIRALKKSLYVGLSTQGYGSVAKTIGKLIINDIQMTSHEVGITADDSHDSISNSFAVFIDEAGSILYSDFIDFLNKNRSSGYQTFIAMQTLADAEMIGPQFKDHLLELCSNWFILKQGNNDYASAIAESIGTFKTVKRSSMTIDDMESERGSVRDVREYLCPPQVIKDLEIGQCILLTKAPSALHFIKLRDIRSSSAFGYVKKAEVSAIKSMIATNPILKASIEKSNAEIKTHQVPVDGLKHFYKDMNS